MSYSTSRRFQPGEGPSRGLLRDCTTSPIIRFAALASTDTGSHLTNTLSINLTEIYFGPTSKSMKDEREGLSINDYGFKR